MAQRRAGTRDAVSLVTRCVGRLRLRPAGFVVRCAGGGPRPALGVFGKFAADMTPQTAGPYLFDAPPISPGKRSESDALHARPV